MATPTPSYCWTCWESAKSGENVQMNVKDEEFVNVSVSRMGFEVSLGEWSSEKRAVQRNAPSHRCLTWLDAGTLYPYLQDIGAQCKDVGIPKSHRRE